MGLIIDNFAGGGGASTGIEQALGRPVDIAINHDEAAIAVHAANHPATKHYCQSIYSVDPMDVTEGRPVALVWFSPDCKHHSKAKGGKPRDKNIRDLANVVPHWIERLKKATRGEGQPTVILLENVEEFRHWGPLDDEGMPIKERRGEEFDLWVRHIRKLGYKVEWRELRACDYGAPTSRKRLFLVARCDGLPIVWPTPTHGHPDSDEVRSGKLRPFRTAAECIDWSIPCPSIFGRKKPLAEATHKRIAAGVMRYVVNSARPFIVPVTHSADERIPILLDTPAALRWLSCEPLLGPVDLREFGMNIHHHPDNSIDHPSMPALLRAVREKVGSKCVDWVVAGGESGPGARPMHPDWARSLRQQCAAAGVPFLFKQWGNWAPNCLCDTDRAHRDTPRPTPGKPGCMFHCGKKAAGRLLDGVQHDGYPA